MQILAFLFGSKLALAEGPLNTPNEIYYVPPGSTITIGGLKHKTPGKTWLFPESHYMNALSGAQKLQICEPALLKLRGDFETLLESHSKEAKTCKGLLEEYIHEEAVLMDENQKLKAKNAELTWKISSARKSSALAWSITGTVITGAGTLTYFILQESL